MNKIIALMAALLVAACTNPASTISNKKSAVVAIASERTEGDKAKGGLGTGWLLRENYIVTNHHVIENSKKIIVASELGEMEHEAELVYSDPVADLAVIRLKDWKKFADSTPYQYLRMAGREDIKSAETVYAIGHPWGLFWTVSKGIISSEMRRSSNAPGFYLQTDAHVFNGNSGGPLLNENGDLIGVNNAMIVNTGGSFGIAIPVPMVKKVLDDLDKFGEVRWCVIGVSLDENMAAKEVTENRPAAQAGIKVGDKIKEVHVNGRTIRPRNTDHLISEINLCNINESIDMRVQRGDVNITVKVKPAYRLSSDYSKVNIKPESDPKLPTPEK